MEVWIDWSSSCGDYSNNRKRSSSSCGVVNRSPDIGTGTRGAEMEEDDLIFQLRSLKQVSHIRSYIEAFDELNSRAGIEENQALSIFLSGLVDEIRVPVCMFKPRTLDEAYALSKLQELTITVMQNKDGVDCSMKDSIRNLALKTELELDSEMDIDLKIGVENEPVADTDAVCEQQLSELQTDVAEGELNLVMEGTESLNDHHEGELGKEEVHVAALGGVEIFMPMGKSTEVKKGRELEQDTLKGTECISYARQNAQVNELYYSLSLPWLLNWFPRPTVKLKFVAQRDDELYEEWGSHESHEERKLQPISSITDLQSYKLSSYQKSTSYLAVEISDAELERIVVPPRFIGKESDHVVFEFSDSKQLKEAESLPTARPNAPVRELSVVLPILHCYSLSLSWLLNWFPRPTVKLKFVARCDDELYEVFADRSKGFVGCGEISIYVDKGQLGTKWENWFRGVERQLDQRSSDLRHLPGLFDGVFSRSDFGGNVFGDGSYPLGSVVPGVSRGLKRSLVDNFRIQKLLEVCNGEHEIHVLLRVIKEPGKLVRISLKAYDILVVQNLIETLKKRSQISLAISAVGLGFLAFIKDLSGSHVVQWGLQCFTTKDSLLIFFAATKFSNPVSNRCFWTDVRVTKGNLHISLVNEIEAYKRISRKSPCSKRISSPASLFTLLKEIGGLGHVDMGEEATALVLTEVIMMSLVMKMNFLTNLANWVFDGGGFNRAIYIDVLAEDASLTATPNLECSLYECAILQLYNMLLVDVSWELVDESMVVGRESVMSVKNALAILGKEWGKSRRFVLQFDTDVKGEGSAGRKEAYGAKSDANWELQILTTPTDNGSTYRLLEWLLVWVPKPLVKMRLGKDDSIQGFLWVPFPDAYVPYFPGDILLRDREATLNIQVIKVNLECATARMKNQGVAHVLVHWVHSSLADATWEFAEEIKACFPGFIGDDEA